MNAKAAKDDRRQLRRVLGDDAMTLLAECRKATNAQAARAVELGTAVDNLDRRVSRSAADLDLRLTHATAVLRRGFWGRLRWLLVGKA